MTFNLDILKLKLCNAIDSEGQVLENSTVLEIITQLHSLDITTEELERTRLGKFVNLIRKNSKQPDIANKAKALVKKWKKLIVTSKPELANGFRRKRRDDSRESTPTAMAPRSDTPLSYQHDCDSREATPLTNGHTNNNNNHHDDDGTPTPAPPAPITVTSRPEGVEYQEQIYPWTETIPIKAPEGGGGGGTSSEVPQYVILPYVSLN